MVLSEILAGYKRSTGFDEMQRLYPSTIGAEALQALRQALVRQWPTSNLGCSQSFIELRSRLREHLNQLLLRRLVHENRATPVLSETRKSYRLAIEDLNRLTIFAVKKNQLA
jgi:hypothetical protein